MGASKTIGVMIAREVMIGFLKRLWQHVRKIASSSTLITMQPPYIDAQLRHSFQRSVFRHFAENQEEK